MADVTIAERSEPSSASSHSIAGRSRWLVGSSRRRMSGSGASARASATRRPSPPDRTRGSSSAGTPRRSEEIGGAVVDRRRRRDLPRHRRARSSPSTDPAPAAGSGRWRRCAARARRASGSSEPGGDLQQRRFARAVAADEGEPVALAHLQPRIDEERRAAEGQADVAEGEDRGGRGQGVVFLRCGRALSGGGKHRQRRTRKGRPACGGTASILSGSASA